jgi:predicted nucleic acid-binding Zn ribbon protein
MTWRPLASRASDKEPLPLRHSLDQLARSLGNPGARAAGKAFAQWERLVGPSLAAHARPVAVTAGRLVVEVDNPAWATQVRWLAPQLLARLAEAAGEEVAEGVDVRVASHGRG